MQFLLGAMREDDELTSAGGFISARIVAGAVVLKK